MCGKKYYRNNKLELTAKINDELKIITCRKIMMRGNNDV